MSLVQFQGSSAGIAGRRISLSGPPASGGGISLTGNPSMMTSGGKNHTGVLLVESDDTPHRGDILFEASTTTMTIGHNEISHVTVACLGTWKGDIDQQVLGTVMNATNDDGEQDRWVVTYQKSGVQYVRNMWKGLYTTSLEPETVFGLSLGPDGLIGWIGEEPSTVGTPLTGEYVPITKAVYYLHRRAEPDDEFVKLVRFYY